MNDGVNESMDGVVQTFLLDLPSGYIWDWSQLLCLEISGAAYWEEWTLEAHIAVAVTFTLACRREFFFFTA